MLDDNAVKALLRKQGYKFTHQRWEVYNVFVEHSDRHLSSEEVFELVQEKDENLGIATVYRTVQLFEELGILYSITFEDGVNRYELRDGMQEHYHHHLICTGCNRVIEFKMDLLDDLEEKIQDEQDFQITDHHVKFYGYCSQCRKTAEGETK